MYRGKGHFQRADSKIMQKRAKKEVCFSECCERHDLSVKRGPCFIHVPWRRCQDFCPVLLRTANTGPVKASLPLCLNNAPRLPAKRKRNRRTEGGLPCNEVAISLSLSVVSIQKWIQTFSGRGLIGRLPVLFNNRNFHVV